MNKLIPEAVEAAERLAFQKGEAAAPYRNAFTEQTGIEVPEPPNNGKLRTTSQGREFFYLRGRDILGVVANGNVDAGVIGTDVVLEYGFSDKQRQLLQYQRLGNPVCRYALMAFEEEVASMRATLNGDQRCASPPIYVPTPYPNMLTSIAAGRDLPLLPYRGLDTNGRPGITGAGEVYAYITGLGCVADIVETGRTSQAEGLLEVETLMPISAELVIRKTDETL